VKLSAHLAAKFSPFPNKTRNEPFKELPELPIRPSGREQMAQISTIPAQAPVVAEPPTPPAPVTPEERALTRSVSAAVQTVNDAKAAGEGREVTFSVDRATRQPVITNVDTTTKEIVQQWPPAYLLQLAADTNLLPRDSG
jgi:hypothetical protein